MLMFTEAKSVDEATFAPSEKTSILILHFQHLRDILFYLFFGL